MIGLKERIEHASTLRMIHDVTLWPKINPKKAKKAIKKYGSRGLKPDDLLLIIDNTILRSAKQGMFLTADTLYAFSEYSKKFSIKISEIHSLEPKVERPLGVPVVGIEINGEYFMALPGLNEEIKAENESVPAILLLTIFLSQVSSCEIK